MKNMSQGVAGKEISIREMLSSPVFYLSLFPHALSLFFVLKGDLGYFYVFFIFYLELIADIFILSLAVLLTKNQQIQKIYKSTYHKVFLAARTMIGGLAICLFFGVFAFFIFAIGGDNLLTIDTIFNNVVLLSVGVYLATKIINFIINIFKYRVGKQPYIEKGESLAINLFTLILFVVPGIHLLLLLKLFFNNIQPVAIIILFIIRAYIDAGVSIQKETIEADYRKLYTQ